MTKESSGDIREGDNEGEEYISIHSDYTKIPEDQILNQIIYDLEHSSRELYSEDFPPLNIINNLKDISVRYDYALAQKFYLRMADCFMEAEAWVVNREFSNVDSDGFCLPCRYRDKIYNVLGFKEETRPEFGCPYCPYDWSLYRCMCLNNFSIKTKIFEIQKVASCARSEFNVQDPNRSQFNYICRNMGDFFKAPRNLKWMNYDSAKLVWKKCYQLIAYCPLKEGVLVGETADEND